MEKKENKKNTVGSGTQTAKKNKGTGMQQSARRQKMHQPPERAIYLEYKKKQSKKNDSTITRSKQSDKKTTEKAYSANPSLSWEITQLSTPGEKENKASGTKAGDRKKKTGENIRPRPHGRQAQSKRKKELVLSNRLLLLIIFIVFLLVSIIVISSMKHKKNEPRASVPGSSSSSVTSPVSEASKYPSGTDPLTLGSITQLVNQSHGLPQTYEPGDLVYNDLPSMRETYLRSEAASALSVLFAEAEKDGAALICCSGYRSYDSQVEVYADEEAYFGSESAKMTTAPPGYSEHQTGLCIDLTSDSVGRALTTDFINTTEGQWLDQHAWEYGFIIRYPNGKENITGYTYEPWHIRYLGKALAKSVHESGKTYEEYLGILN